MESSTYQTAFTIWDVPSSHSNCFDVLLTTSVWRCPYGLAKLPRFPGRWQLLFRRLSELALYGPVSWVTSQAFWICLGMKREGVLSSFRVSPAGHSWSSLFLVEAFERLMWVWKALLKCHAGFDALEPVSPRRPGEMVLFSQATWKLCKIRKRHQCC